MRDTLRPKNIPQSCSFMLPGNAIEKYSRKAWTIRTKKTPAKTQGGPQPIRRTSSGIPTAAVSDLDLRLDSTSLQRWWRWNHDLLIRSTESPAPALKLEKGLQIFLLPKIRPKGGGHIEFTIGNLPKIEITDPQLAAGPDQEVRIGHTGRIHTRRDHRFVDFLRLGLPFPHLVGDPLHHSYDLVAPAIAERQDHRHPLVVACQVDHMLEGPPNAERQAILITDR